MTSQKIFYLTIFLLSLIIAGIFFWSKKNTPLISPTPATSQINLQSPTPSPSPTPLLNITGQSNLESEINKLKVPEFNSDYQKLDQTIFNELTIN